MIKRDERAGAEDASSERVLLSPHVLPSLISTGESRR